MNKITSSAMVGFTNCPTNEGNLDLLIGVCFLFLASMLLATYWKYKFEYYKNKYMDLKKNDRNKRKK